MGVVELGKPYAHKCPHQCPTGCAIYGQHPKTCQTFYCGWQEGEIPLEARPDKCGLLFAMGDTINRGPTMIVHETRPNVFQDSMPQWAVDYIKDTMAHGLPVVLVEYGDRLGTSYPIAPEYPQGSHNNPGDVSYIGGLLFRYIPQDKIDASQKRAKFFDNLPRIWEQTQE
jgi:hypothetical protein